MAAAVVYDGRSPVSDERTVPMTSAAFDVIVVGGLKIDTSAHVLDIADQPIPGLYAAGELVGGLFYFNYPGSAGLMAGAVFGRIAGRTAAEHREALAR
jgi:succinate dehydrogenase/fumarate reductase flavoprotein subunit